MRAQLLQTPAPIDQAPLQAADLPLPEPNPDQIRLKIHVCGVCHTDLHIVEADLDLPRLPIVPGHQIIGTVEALGQNVTRFASGDRVGVPWLYATCGRCRYCAAGKENLCENIQFTGYHAPGGYAEYMVVGQDFAYPIPARFSDAQAAPLLCAGIIGYRALRLSEIQPCGRLGLYGFGASAHICLQIARHWGCEVFVFTRGQHHRQLAEKLGAVWAGGTEDDPGARMDSSIIFAPAGWIVPEALRVLDKGGALALAGIHMSPIPEIPYNLLYHERTLRSVANSTRQDAIDLLRTAEEVPVQTEVEVFPLAAANEALRRLKRSEINGAGVLQVID